MHILKSSFDISLSSVDHNDYTFCFCHGTPHLNNLAWVAWVAWDQVPQWGKGEKQRTGKKSVSQISIELNQTKSVGLLFDFFGNQT